MYNLYLHSGLATNLPPACVMKLIMQLCLDSFCNEHIFQNGVAWVTKAVFVSSVNNAQNLNIV